MIRSYGVIAMLAFSNSIYASPMNDAYEEARSKSSQYTAESLRIIQSANPPTINIPEIKYRSSLSDSDHAKDYALSNTNVKQQYDTAVQMKNDRESTDDAIIEQERKLIRGAESIILTNGYCMDGKCEELKDEPNRDMIKSTAVLNDVLGGGHDYSQAGAGSKIYAGNIEKCKKEKWGVADCCTDEGWGVDLNLMQCPSDTKTLGEKKAAGKCHYVGKYEKTIRKGGIVIGHEEFKSYCCYGSKMARVTQEGAKSQLGRDFGTPKYPHCEGISTDEFATLDFSKINLSEIYGDMEGAMVIPVQEKLLERPGSYYEEKGIPSW